VPETKTALVAKLAKVMGGLDRVPKRGRNEFHKYDYVMEADLADAVRQDLAQAGIMIFPQILTGTVQWTDTVNKDGNPNGKIFSAMFMFTFTDGEFSETVVVPGCGHDNPGDKAPYKAMTGAEKYALMKTFLIPTGDDPEDDNGEAKPRATKVPADEAPRKTPAAPAAPAAGKSAFLVPFGKSKGKSISDISESDLSYLTKYAEEKVEAKDPKWHDKNVEFLNALKAEWARRQPWRDVWGKAVEYATRYAVGEAQLIDIMKDVTGKSHANELVAEDLPKIQGEIIRRGE